MKNIIKKIVIDAVKHAFENGNLPSNQIPSIQIEETKHESHGDFSTNFAMVSASVQKMAPQKIAQIIVSAINNSVNQNNSDKGQNGDNVKNSNDTEIVETAGLFAKVEKVEIAGPGFINFFLSNKAWHPVVDHVLDQDKLYGASDIGKNEKVQVEFVSANPTGPLHVGHGRGAAVGDSVGNILSFAGFDVQKEYYINDSGRQIRTLGTSVRLMLLQKACKEIDFPDDCYKGDYVKELAIQVLEKQGNTFIQKDEKDGVALCARFAAKKILQGIKDDLEDFGVTFDQWFSEQSLYDSKRVEKAIDEFKSKDLIYEKDGALWFRTQDFGDEKDRVVVKNNGLTTYFASDIAYHKEKYERGFDRVIDVWGADHHGYINRINASIIASGKKSEQFNVILVQLVNLLRGGKPFQMSTRSGEFVTLKNIVDEVGKDAARFLFLSRSYDSGLDFDLELAKQKNSENPVYYVQYVHARITGILLKAKQENIISTIDFNKGEHLDLLNETEEIRLIKILNAFKENVEKSATTMHPHIIFTYLMTLASAFHGYYNKHKVLSDDNKIVKARLSLVLAVKKVIRNGLTLLGVSAPERM